MLKALTRFGGRESIKVKIWVYFEGRIGKIFCKTGCECNRKRRVKVGDKVFSPRN